MSYSASDFVDATTDALWGRSPPIDVGDGAPLSEIADHVLEEIDRLRDLEHAVIYAHAALIEGDAERAKKLLEVCVARRSDKEIAR